MPAPDLETTQDRRRDYLTWALYVLLFALKLGLIWDQTTTLGEKFSPSWLHVYRASTLAKGEWLGGIPALALQRPPGAALWVAFCYWIHLPLRLAADFLLGGAAFAMALSAGRAGLARPWRVIIFYLFLFAPETFSLHAQVSAKVLHLPLNILAASLYLLGATTPRASRRWAYSVGVGLCMALDWISVQNAVSIIGLFCIMVLWEFWEPKAEAMRSEETRPSRGRWWAVILPMLAVLFGDLAVRVVNYDYYRTFSVVKRSSVYRVVGEKFAATGSIDATFKSMTRQRTREERTAPVKIVGWVFRGNEPVQKVELLDEHGQRLGGTDRFIDRPTVPEFFSGRGKMDAPLKVGFEFETRATRSKIEKMKLVFFEKNARTEIPVANVQPVPPEMLYWIDSVEKKTWLERIRETVITANGRLYELLAGTLLFLALLGGVLTAFQFLSGRLSATSLDFWTLALLAMALAAFPAWGRPPQLWETFFWRTPSMGLGLLLSYRSLKPFTGTGFSETSAGSWVDRLPDWSPPKAFLALALVFGLGFALLNPPFQAPDEGAHAYRAYQTAQGEGKEGTVPVSVLKVSAKYWKLAFHPENKIFFTELWEGFRIPLDDDSRVRMGTASLTFIPYLPQAFAIAIGKLFQLPPLALMYLGRVSNLLAYIGLVYAALRILPFFRWVFFALALNPMSLYEAASLSHDAFTNGACFLWIAVFLALAYGPDSPWTWKRGLGLALLTVLVSLSKPVYFPLFGLYFLIPRSRVGSWFQYLSWFFGICGLGFALNYVLTQGVMEAKVAGASAVSVEETQFQYLASQPWVFLKVLAETYATYWKFFLESFLGKLGWLDTQLPLGLLAADGFVLLSLGLVGGKRDQSLGGRGKLVVGAVLLASGLLLSLALYLTWSPVRHFRIEGLQGRYFIPLSPLFLLLFNNRRLSFPKLAGLAPMAMSFILVATLLALLNRYYYL